MKRSSKLLILVSALAAAPLPALAQTWPAAVVASAHAMAPARFVVTPMQDQTAPPPVTSATIAALAKLPTPKATVPARNQMARADLPEIEIPAKAEWSDDQGFRVGVTKVAYKTRF